MVCYPPYLWWECNFDDQFYHGCCIIDACQQTPVGCPINDQQPSSLVPVPSVTFPIFPPPDSPSLVATSATSSQGTSTSPVDAISQTTSTLSPTGNPQDAGNSAILIPVGALVGIVVGCFLLAILVALPACLWWVCYKRKKRESLEAAARADTSANGGVGSFGMLANPEAIPRAPTPSLRMEGRVSQDNPRDTGDYSAIVSLPSPGPPGSLAPQDISPTTWELDSAPFHGTLRRRGASELDTSASVRSEPIPYTRPRLRATLNPTENESGPDSYPNSWTKFGNVQL